MLVRDLLAVAPGSADAAKAGLDLGGVDPSLYAGGFDDFDPGPGVDIAQTANGRSTTRSWSSSGTTP